MMSKANEPLSLEQAMHGILALLAAEREERVSYDKSSVDPRKTELVLADSGMTLTQIASILGKKNKLVSQTIIRARNKDSKGDANGEK